MTAAWAAALLLAAPVAVDAGASPDAGVPALAARVLADGRFGFCHEPRYPLTEHEARWCALIRSGAPTPCPAFVAACKQGVGARLLGRRDRLNFAVPDLGLPLRALLMAALAGTLGLLIWLVIRGAAAWRDRGRSPSDDGDQPAGRLAARATGEPTDEVERDVERLLARARAASAAGDHAGGIAHLHAALLRRLEGAGLVVVHPACTNGEYLRQVARGQQAVLPEVSALVRTVERTQFGDVTASAGLVDDLLGRVARLRLGAALGLLLPLVGAGCRPDRGGWDHSPSGRAAVIELFRAAGRDARERFTPLTKLRPDGGDAAIVLLPGANVAAEEWAALKGWVDAGGALVVASVPEGAPGWLGARSVDDLASRTGAIRGTSGGEDQTGLALHLPAPRRLQLDGRGWRPLFLLARDSVYAARRGQHKGDVLVVGDAQLFTNAALAFGDNATALVGLLPGRRIELVGELTGLVSPNPVASVRRGRLLPFVMQLGLAACLFFLWKGVPFGRLLDPPAPGRRDFVEHARALGQQYRRGHAARHVLAAYGAWAIERLRERVRPGHGSLIALAEGVAARTGRPAGEVMRLLMEVREGAEPPATGNARQRRAGEAAAQLRLMGDISELLQGTRRHDAMKGTDERRRVQG